MEVIARFLLLIAGLFLMIWAVFEVYVTFSGSEEREMFEEGGSRILKGLDWLFTFDIAVISLHWYAGLICLILGLFSVFKKKKV